MERGQFEEESKEFPPTMLPFPELMHFVVGCPSFRLLPVENRKPIQKEEEEMSREWLEKMRDGQAFKSPNDANEKDGANRNLK